MASDNHITRREFLTISAAIVASSATSGRVGAASVTSNPASSLSDPWLTISAVQQHMLPGGNDSPGALDINARGYLQSMINMPGVGDGEREFILNGPGWLNEVTEQKFSKHFSQLDQESREAVLRQIEATKAGERWLSKILTNLLEALLSDPVYGGNTDAAGWEWLQHQPGFPRPTINKGFNHLGYYRRRYTKA